MTKLPDHPQSQAEYQHLQQTCDVISREIGKLEAETGVGAEEKRVVSVPQDATMDEIVALDIFRMKLDTLHQLGLAAIRRTLPGWTSSRRGASRKPTTWAAGG